MLAVMLLGWGSHQQAHAQATPFTCSSTLYLSQTSPSSGTLYTIDRSSNPFTYPVLGAGGLGINALAYNPTDNFLYALRTQSSDEGRRLYRIDSTGARTDLGLVTGLPAPTGSAYFAGSFTAAGDNMLYVMDGTESNRMYRINVATMQASLVALSRNLYVADFDVFNGLLYGLESFTGQLVSINPATGLVTNVGPPGPTGTFGAFYADSGGIYGARNTSGGFYRFDPVTGRQTLISDAPPSTGNDGARCPLGPALTFNADLAITKTDNSAVYTPGTNVVYTIVVSNNGPFGAQNARVQDALPSGVTTAAWTCVATGNAVCRTASGSGAIDARVDLPVGGAVTFTMTMAVPLAFSGDLVNTATVSPGAGNVDPVSGNNSASDTDVGPTVLTLRKALPSGRLQATDQFRLSIAGAGAPAAVTTTGTGTTATGQVRHAGATAGSSYTLSESAAGTTVLANYATTYACTNTRAGGQTPSGNGATFNVTPVAGDNLTCTFSNARRPQLTLIKTVTNDDGGTQLPTAWTLSAAGPTPISGSTGSAAVTNAAVNPGIYALSESAAPTGYSATPYNCTINGGPPISGNSITLSAGDSAVCRIHNDDTGVPGQPVACGITSHSGANGASFAFGPAGVNGSATLQNIVFEPGSVAGGSLSNFVDSNGRTYSTPPGPGRWLLTNSNTTTRVTVTFSPAIPAHRIGLAIYDIGTWDSSLPNNNEDPAYNPALTLALTGGATSTQFVAHRTGALATLARFTPATGVVTMDNTVYQTGVERTWRQSVFLRGNSNALVSTLTLTATNIKSGDAIGLGLVAIPSCVTLSKVTEGGVGTFNFTTANLNNWDNTASATPVVLTTTTPGTSVSSVRHFYAHPISSANQGTQPVTLTEVIPPGWVLSPAQCTDANSSRNGNIGSFGSLSGGTLTIPADRLRFESNITCRFTNTLTETDVRVEKTASGDPTVSGSVVTYTIVVNNDGPAPAHGTVLTDTPGPGLNCTAPSVTLVCTATGGAACPSGTIPVSTLTGSGMTIPTLPAGGRVTATVQCTVTATGVP